jgi:hypothetical protein
MPVSLNPAGVFAASHCQMRGWQTALACDPTETVGLEVADQLFDISQPATRQW